MAKILTSSLGHPHIVKNPSKTYNSFMSLFKYKPKKKNAQTFTGWTHGLAFKDDKINWTIPLDSLHGILVVGSKADDIGSRVIKALAQTSDEAMTIDFQGEGLTSLNTSSNTAENLKEATDLLARIKQDLLHTLQSKLSDSSKTSMLDGILRSSGSSDSSPQEFSKSPLLVINGLKPRDLNEFAPSDTNTEDKESNGEVGLPLKPDLDASIEEISASREALSELADNDLMEAIENVIKAARTDTVPAVIVRWSLVLRITEALRKMTPEELEAAGHEGIVTNDNDKLPLPEDPLIIQSIDALQSRENEDLVSWAERLARDSVTAQAALALTQCDSRLGLPWDPIGGFEDRQKAIRVLKNAVEAGRESSTIRMTPLQRLWADVATLMRLSRETGMRTVIIATEPDLEALAEVMPSIDVRVIAGDLKSSDSWVAGVLNEGDIIDYGSGDLQVVSLAKIGRLRSSIGTLRSPFMKSSYTMIDLI